MKKEIEKKNSHHSVLLIHFVSFSSIASLISSGTRSLTLFSGTKRDSNVTGYLYVEFTGFIKIV